jgi:hypothetical protein
MALIEDKIMDYKITILDAFKAMIVFLDDYYYRFGQNNIASVLSDIQLIDEERTADPAAWFDWLEAVKKVKNKK